MVIIIRIAGCSKSNLREIRRNSGSSRYAAERDKGGKCCSKSYPPPAVFYASRLGNTYVLLLSVHTSSCALHCIFTQNIHLAQRLCNTNFRLINILWAIALTCSYTPGLRARVQERRAGLGTGNHSAVYKKPEELLLRALNFWLPE